MKFQEWRKQHNFVLNQEYMMNGLKNNKLYNFLVYQQVHKIV